MWTKPQYRKPGELTSEQHRKDENQPQAGACSPLEAGDAQDRDLRARVEAQPEHDTQGVHLPRPIDDPEQLPEDDGQEPRALQRQLSTCRVLSCASVAAIPALLLLLPQQDPQPRHEPIQHPRVARAEDQQEGGADAGPDYVPHPLEPIEALPERPARGRDHDAGDDDDGGVAQAEPRADADGPLAGGDEAPGHQVDGADVVGVEGVPQAQGVGQHGGGDEQREEVQDDAHGGPHDGVGGDEEQYLPCDRRGEGPEGFGERQGPEVDVQPGEGETGHLYGIIVIN